MGMGMGGMGQMMQTMNGWLGDRMLVSGRVQPAIDAGTPHLSRAAFERLERPHLQTGVERRRPNDGDRR